MQGSRYESSDSNTMRDNINNKGDSRPTFASATSGDINQHQNAQHLGSVQNVHGDLQRGNYPLGATGDYAQNLSYMRQSQYVPYHSEIGHHSDPRDTSGIYHQRHNAITTSNSNPAIIHDQVSPSDGWNQQHMHSFNQGPVPIGPDSDNRVDAGRFYGDAVARTPMSHENRAETIPRYLSYDSSNQQHAQISPRPEAGVHNPYSYPPDPSSYWYQQSEQNPMFSLRIPGSDMPQPQSRPQQQNYQPQPQEQQQTEFPPRIPMKTKQSYEMGSSQSRSQYRSLESPEVTAQFPSLIGQPAIPPDGPGQNKPSNSAHTQRRILTDLWEEEGTLCLVVELRGVQVIRRCDNNMINGTKLLNSAQISRGRRDGVLKGERYRRVVKVGGMNFKGVWIPFERALDIAYRENVLEELYPLFIADIEPHLYSKQHISRLRQQLLKGARRNPKFLDWLDGIPANATTKKPSMQLSGVESSPSESGSTIGPSQSLDPVGQRPGSSHMRYESLGGTTGRSRHHRTPSRHHSGAAVSGSISHTNLTHYSQTLKQVREARRHRRGLSQNRLSISLQSDNPLSQSRSSMGFQDSGPLSDPSGQPGNSRSTINMQGYGMEAEGNADSDDGHK